MGTTRVPAYLVELIELERQLEQLLGRYADAATGNARVEAMLADLSVVTGEHRQALQRRLSELGAEKRQAGLGLMPIPHPAEGPTTPLGALHLSAGALNHLLAAYAIVHTASHRFFDGIQEGNTADLVEQHLRRYTGAGQEINQILSDVVVSELDRDGEPCRCQCPSCNLGICLCAPHGTNTIRQAWQETSPLVKGPGVLVRTPRPGSVAAEAGLRAGDQVMSADGQEVPSEAELRPLQEAISGHSSGEEIELRVRRKDRENETIRVTRP